MTYLKVIATGCAAALGPMSGLGCCDASCHSLEPQRLWLEHTEPVFKLGWSTWVRGILGYKLDIDKQILGQNLLTESRVIWFRREFGGGGLNNRNHLSPSSGDQKSKIVMAAPEG